MLRARSLGGLGEDQLEAELVSRLDHGQADLKAKEVFPCDRRKSLVVIGDATPHDPNYILNKLRLDWRKECHNLKEKGIRIYSVQALNRQVATDFYREMARLTDGFHLTLDQFSSIVNFMMAICYREQGLDNLQTYENEVPVFRV